MEYPVGANVPALLVYETLKNGQCVEINSAIYKYINNIIYVWDKKHQEWEQSGSSWYTDCISNTLHEREHGVSLSTVVDVPQKYTKYLGWLNVFSNQIEYYLEGYPSSNHRRPALTPNYPHKQLSIVVPMDTPEGK